MASMCAKVVWGTSYMAQQLKNYERLFSQAFLLG